MITVIKKNQAVRVTTLKTQHSTLTVRNTGNSANRVTSINVGKTGQGIDDFNVDPTAYYILAKA